MSFNVSGHKPQHITFFRTHAEEAVHRLKLNTHTNTRISHVTNHTRLEMKERNKKIKNEKEKE